MNSKNKFQLAGQIRTQSGKSASRRMRKPNEASLVPAIVYGAGKEPQMISLAYNEISQALQNEAIHSHILKLNVANQEEQVVLKEVQRHPVRGRVMHLDFLRIRADEKISMSIPVHFLNEKEAPGIQEGAVISHHMTEIPVECLPADLPEFLEIDVSHLNVGDAIHLSQVKLPKGVELGVTVTDEEGDAPVVSMHMPRAAKEETEEAAASEVAPGEVPAAEQKSATEEGK